MALTIGLDVGTTCAKGCLMDESANVLAQVTGPTFATSYPAPGWAEQNPDDWWHSAVVVIRQLLRVVPKGEQVQAIGVSGQGCACTLIDANGNVLRPAIIWLDTRARAEVDILQEGWGNRLRQLNGNAFGAFNVEPKLLWLARHEPAIVAHSRHTFTTTSYIVYRLTRIAAMNVADAGLLFGFDPSVQQWDRQFIEGMGVPSRLYPPVHQCESVVGTITQSVAEETGLPAHVRVVAGGEDTPAAALSVGVVEAGDGFLSLGTAAVVGMCLPYQRQWNDPRLLAYPHVVENRTLVSGSMTSAGAVTEWLRREFGQSYMPDASSSPLDPEFFSFLETEVDSSRPGAGGVIALPYLSGEIHPLLNPHARGVMFGLSLSTTRADVARALVEGAAVAIRHNLEVAKGGGAPVKSLRTTGSPSRSRAWRQIIADVTGVPVIAMEAGGAPVGDALIAASGIGLIDSVSAHAEKLSTVRMVSEPNGANRMLYDELFEAHLQIYEHVLPDFLRSAGIRESSKASSSDSGADAR